MYRLGSEFKSIEGGRINPWLVMGGLLKYFHLTRKEILWDYSFANIMMLSVSIPSSKSIEGEKTNIKKPNEISNVKDLDGLFE